MKNSKTVIHSGVESDTDIRPDVDEEEWRDNSFYKPISIREYFKFLGYCMFGFAVVGLSIGLYFSFIR